jgi:hypothetical protein
VTTPPLKPTKTLAEVVARFRKQLDEQTKPLPKPVTDETPPTPWNETDTDQETK